MICLSSARSISFNATAKDVPDIREGVGISTSWYERKQGKGLKDFTSGRVQNFLPVARSGILLGEFNFA